MCAVTCAGAPSTPCACPKSGAPDLTGPCGTDDDDDDDVDDDDDDDGGDDDDDDGDDDDYDVNGP
eukprot:6959908-Pyramimonas_sp.AAC.1